MLVNNQDWNHFIERYPDAHLLQTAAWGALKSNFGWRVERLIVETPGGEVGAQVLFRRLPLGQSVAYIGKGPFGQPWPPDQTADKGGAFAARNFWPALDAACRQRRAVFLKVEPDVWLGAAPAVPPPGFHQSAHTVQPPRTLVVNLQGDEDELLGRMKQKTRYNIRLAARKGVTVQPSTDVAVFHRLMQITGGRDGFGVHSLNYFQQVYELFHPLGQCELLLAEYQGEPLAGLMVFARGARAWYLYGASSNAHRERMPAYLIQWEAMRWARARGCREYDLWGAPDADEDQLEAEFMERSDDLWGVYRFKRGFGGELRRNLGPWDRVYNAPAYLFYRWWVERRRGIGAGA